MIYESLAGLILKSILGGVVAFISPCNIALLPTFLSYITSTAKNRYQSFFLSIAFALGYSLTTGVVMALFIGPKILFEQTHLVPGILTILIAIYLFFLKDIQKFFRKIKEKRKKNQISNQVNEQQSLIMENSSSNTSPEKELESLPNQIMKSGKSIYIKIGGSLALGFSIGLSALACTSGVFGAVLTTLGESGFAASASSYLYIFIAFGLGLFVPYLIIGVFIGEINNRYLMKMIKFGSILDKVLAIILLWIGIEIICSGYNIDLLFKSI